MRAAIKLLYVCSVTAKGHKYWYVRKPGCPAVRLRAKPGTMEFVREYQEVMAAIKDDAVERPERGTLGHLIVEYKASEQWSALAESSRLAYGRMLAILDAHADEPLKNWTRSNILKMRDRVWRPRHGVWTANYIVTVLQVLFAFGNDTGIVDGSPLAERVRRLRGKKDPDARQANRPWTAEERATVLAEAPPHMLLPIALAMTTGLRRRDVLTVQLSAIKNGEIEVKTSKRGKVVRVPMHAVLIEALNKRPTSPVPTIAVNSLGDRWSYGGWGGAWHVFKAQLEAEGKIGPGLTMHGLRHTMGALLHEAGASDRDIGDVLGNTIPRHYSQNAPMPEEAKDRVRKLRIVD